MSTDVKDDLLTTLLQVSELFGHMDNTLRHGRPTKADVDGVVALMDAVWGQVTTQLERAAASPAPAAAD